MVARADRATWQGGVLQRGNCREDSGLDEAAQRTDDRARHVRILQRICRADFLCLSRLDDLRAATERAGHRGAGNAEHHGDISAWTKRLGFRVDESAARDDRGKEASVRGSCEIHWRPEETEIAGCDAAYERVGGAKGQVD